MKLEVDALDAAGRGVARNAGKVVFVEGALAGELVEARLLESRSKFDLARATSVLRASSGRREPRCAYFGVCGGCATQHVDARTQVASKQRWLEDNLARIGKVRAGAILPPIYGQEWGYRHRARLSVRYVEGKGGALVGFRERRSTYVADIRSCEVLPPGISALIVPLRDLIGKLSIRDRVPQIEIAAGEAATVLLFRHLLPLSEGDQALLREFADSTGVRVWLQPQGPDSAKPFHPERHDDLYYDLPEFGVRIAFQPADFTQVNPAVNRLLVSRAVRLLDPQPGERVADLFCGIGNFSLPLATRGAQVIGFEGSALLVERARQNAAANRLVAQFEVAELFKPNLGHFGRFDKFLLDPPREGAIGLVNSLPDDWPRRIVYVSCDPATLARDADILVHHKGFQLSAAGIVNMFPHTAHVESIALFERD
ncbi:MAG: 23S rRNA (uracil(1939)-C(5))-methyltransferase [Betaproteobacteria bacterium RBG_16_66_20]|nr:MAG: 23S rRNA (uracil(1939)-C(5))-methyltransferase [Betaproteobacteria bacterium RBG_16_66_20]